MSKLHSIFAVLLEQHGPLNWWPAETPFEVCIGAILTQNTNWGNVEKAIANLRRGTLLSPKAIRDVSTELLAEAIRPAGYYNIKSGRLKDFVLWLFAEFDGELDQMFLGDWKLLREKLLRVRGIGPETGDSIILYAGNKPTFVVDAYTKRLFARLGIVEEGSGYEDVRRIFMEELPADAELYNEYHALIVQHCKEYCRKSRKEKLCGACFLNASGHCFDPVASPLLGTVERLVRLSEQ